MVATFGILNLTRDSFSDGGQCLDPQAALARAERLVAAGAAVVDVGAESTHPDAEDVPAAEEIARLQAVVPALVARGHAVSVDTVKPAVMRAAVEMGVLWLNDVAGFRDSESLAAAAAAPATVRCVVMFSRSQGPRADRPEGTVAGLLDEIRGFVAERLAAFAAVGEARERLVFDPGMGFFLGRTAAPSLQVLQALPQLVALGVPWLVSVSRKSLVGEVTGRPVAERRAGTLAAELWAARHGAQWIRTHDPGAFHDGWRMEQAIAAAGSGNSTTA